MSSDSRRRSTPRKSASSPTPTATAAPAPRSAFCAVLAASKRSCGRRAPPAQQSASPTPSPAVPAAAPRPRSRAQAARRKPMADGPPRSRRRHTSASPRTRSISKTRFQTRLNVKGRPSTASRPHAIQGLATAVATRSVTISRTRRSVRSVPSGRVLGVEADVLDREIADTEPAAAPPLVQVELDSELALAHPLARGRERARKRPPAARDDDAADAHVDPVGVEADARRAGGADEAPPVRVAAVEGGLAERRPADGTRDAHRGLG